LTSDFIIALGAVYPKSWKYNWFCIIFPSQQKNQVLRQWLRQQGTLAQSYSRSRLRL